MTREEAAITHKCPVCGHADLKAWIDESQGTKWGRARCENCDCMGPEVRTGYDKALDAEWREDAKAAFCEAGATLAQFVPPA